MTTLQMLTVRRNAALSRLATLQRRAERIVSPGQSIVRPALKELTDALEELQVANDQLETQVANLALAQANALAANQRFDELLQILPCACVWTSSTGEISEANPAAAVLLNVSRLHLVGRPLMLFLSDRSVFQDAVNQLSAATRTIAEFQGEVRPRERRARPVRVTGRRLENEQQLCWFLLEAGAER